MNNKNDEISLQCFIFRVDYEIDFSLLDKRGQIASELKKSGLFDEIRFSTKESVQCKKNKPHCTLTVTPTNINGKFEESLLNIDDKTRILKIVNKLYNNLKLSTDKIKRIGARFYFIKEEKDFSTANKKYLKLYSNDFISTITVDSLKNDEIKDTGLALRIEKDDFKCRIFTGPLNLDEYKRIFDFPKLVKYETSSHVDFDYYLSEYAYNDMHLEKFVKNAFEKATEISNNIFDILG